MGRETDAAIDAVVALLRAFGEHAFDTDNVPAEQTRAESETAGRDVSPWARSWASKALRPSAISVARGATSRRIARTSGSTSVGEDRAADARVGAQLGHLVAAFGGNDADVIRREAEAVVDGRL